MSAGRCPAGFRRRRTVMALTEIPQWSGSASPAPLSLPPRWPRSPMLCSVLSGGRRCCWAQRWRPPTRRRCSRCLGGGRSPVAAAPSWRARPAPTTWSASPSWPVCSPPTRPSTWGRPAPSRAGSCCSLPSAPWWGQPAGRCWWGSCAGCPCPARPCTRCGCSPAPCSSMARRPSRTAPASWRCSSPASWPGTRAPPTRGRSSASTPRWRAWPRSSPSSRWASRLVCTPCPIVAR
jgi:hypothetical protein